MTAACIWYEKLPAHCSCSWVIYPNLVLSCLLACWVWSGCLPCGAVWQWVRLRTDLIMIFNSTCIIPAKHIFSNLSPPQPILLICVHLPFKKIFMRFNVFHMCNFCLLSITIWSSCWIIGTDTGSNLIEMVQSKAILECSRSALTSKLWWSAIWTVFLPAHSPDHYPAVGIPCVHLTYGVPQPAAVIQCS